MTSLPPNWYPDPSGAPQLRWWDGQQWTAHTHPGQAASTHVPVPEQRPVPEPQPAAKKSRRRSLVIGLAIVAVVVLVITVSVVAVRAFLPTLLGGGVIALSDEATAVDGRDYLMTEPLDDLQHETKFSYPADYNFAQRFPDSLTLGSEGLAEGQQRQSEAFELFLDSSLTVRSSVTLTQYESGGSVTIQPNESSTIMPNAGGGSVQVMPESWGAYFNWGLEEEYYLVRHIDENGEQLDTPVVTKISTADVSMATPQLTAEKEAETGTVRLNWDAVPGATEYIVVGSHNVTTEDDDYRWYFTYATVTDTTWSSEKDVDEFEPTRRQNATMALFDGQSADQLMAEGKADEDDWFVYEKGEFRWSVIASNGTDFSKLGTIDAAGVVGSLPYEVASFEMQLDSYSGAVDATRLPARFAFTGLDGRTRATQAYIAEGDVVLDEYGSWSILISGVGTTLKAETSWFFSRSELASAPAISDFIRDYNAYAESAYSPTTGLNDFEILSGTLEEVEETSDALSDPAEVSYPVYGSDDFVEFLAAHFVAGSELIDITAYADAPGAQPVWDAINEAYYQNPYVVGLDRANFRESSTSDRHLLRIAYSLDADERSRIQQSISDSVDSVVGQVVHEGMSDRDIAIALNDWVAGAAAYDDPAAAVSQSATVPPEYEYAWRADGVFERGSVVCGGYSIAYSALMNAAGIETVVVTGDVLSGGRHAWNKVLIDGSWLAVDVTWNDSSQSNTYLLISDSQFTGEATRTQDVYWVRDDLVGAFATP